MVAVITIFGSYFPAWIACLLIGLLATLVAYLVLRVFGLLSVIPLPAIFYLLTTLFAAMSTWLLFFRL